MAQPGQVDIRIAVEFDSMFEEPIATIAAEESVVGSFKAALSGIADHFFSREDQSPGIYPEDYRIIVDNRRFRVCVEEEHLEARELSVPIEED